jgi:hypothetical protein
MSCEEALSARFEALVGMKQQESTVVMTAH